MAMWRFLKPRREVWEFLIRWRILAIAILLLHVVIVAHYLPLDKRGFISPDDGDALRYGKAIAKGGLPVLDGKDFAPQGFNVSQGFQPIGNHMVEDGKLATVRPPLYFYLMAPAAPLGRPGVFLAAQVVSVLSLACTYLLLERIGGPNRAWIALSLVALHPSTLYWSWYPRSNLMGIGMLSLSVWLMTDRRRWTPALGAFLLPMITLARFELGIPAAAVGLWFGLAMILKRSRFEMLQLALTGLGALAGLAVVLWISADVYHTWNLLNVVSGRIGGESSEVGSALAELAAAPNRLAFLSSQYESFQFLLNSPISALAASILISARNVVVLPMALGSFLATAYIFSGQYSQQPFFMLLSPTRYMLVLILGAAVVFSMATRKVPLSVLVIVGVGLQVSTGAGLSYVDQEGSFQKTRDYSAYGVKVSDEASKAPPNAVFLGQYLANTLPERTVFQPDYYSPGPNLRPYLVESTKRLLGAGIPVYGEYQHGGTTWANWISEDPELNVVNAGILWFVTWENPS